MATAEVGEEEVGAGEVLVIRPAITDRYGNPATCTEGQLQIQLLSPEKTLTELPATTTLKGGLASYETRYEPKAKGAYGVHITLGGEHIQNSPLDFVVLAGFPDVAKSHVVLPEAPLYSNQPYVALLYAPTHGSPRSRPTPYITWQIRD